MDPEALDFDLKMAVGLLVDRLSAIDSVEEVVALKGLESDLKMEWAGLVWGVVVDAGDFDLKRGMVVVALSDLAGLVDFGLKKTEAPLVGEEVAGLECIAFDLRNAAVVEEDLGDFDL